MMTTQKIAYEKVLEDLTERQERVYEIIKKNTGMTVKETAGVMGIEGKINIISGRFSELRDLGLIKQIGIRDKCAVWVNVYDNFAFPKESRIVDNAMLEKYRARNCDVVGAEHYGPVCPHHIKTRKTGGDDSDENLLSLCTHHHTGPVGIHVLSISGFIKRWGRMLRSEALYKITKYAEKRGINVTDI